VTTNQLIEFKTWQHDQLAKECQELTEKIKRRQLEMVTLMKNIEKLNIESSREVSFNTGDVDTPSYRG
jgi:hypothetical protein